MIPQLKEISIDRKSAYDFEFRLAPNVILILMKDESGYYNELFHYSNKGRMSLPLFQSVCLSYDDLACVIAKMSVEDEEFKKFETIYASRDKLSNNLFKKLNSGMMSDLEDSINNSIKKNDTEDERVISRNKKYAEAQGMEFYKIKSELNSALAQNKTKELYDEDISQYYEKLSGDYILWSIIHKQALDVSKSFDRDARSHSMAGDYGLMMNAEDISYSYEQFSEKASKLALKRRDSLKQFTHIFRRLGFDFSVEKVDDLLLDIVSNYGTSMKKYEELVPADLCSYN